MGYNITDIDNTELGHIMFYKSGILRFKCPQYIVALLKDISDKLDMANNNINYENPFSNSGNVEGFKNGVFEVHAFDWNEEHLQKYNFKYMDIEISWYKYLGRDVTINKKISEKEAINMYNACINSIKSTEDDYL